MAYKSIYDEAYLKTLISQIQKLNKRKNSRRHAEQRAAEVPEFNFTQSQKAAATILKSLKNKKKGEKKEND